MSRTVPDLERMTTEWVPALVAAHEAVHGPQNGLTVASLRVLWGDVLDEFTRSA